MKTERLPTRDVRENRSERQEKLGQALETMPGKTLRDRNVQMHNARGGNGPRPKQNPDLHPAILMATLAKQARGTVFSLHAPEALHVTVAGTFNNWNPHATPLVKGANGEWRVEKQLEPGEYEYRFVVDGAWQDDPQARKKRPNPYGSHNSVVSIV